MQRSRARTSNRTSCSQSLHAVGKHRRRASPWKPFPRTPLHMVASRTPIYRCCIGTAIEVDARARSSAHLKPRPFPLSSLMRASLLQISGFSLNIASALPCLLCGIPEFPSSLLILPYGGAALHQRAEESIAFQSGVAESTVLQMMTMQQTISRGPGMAPVKAPNTTAQAE